MASSECIQLNIGGTIFQTTRYTLIKYDSMFRGMLESGIPLKTDSSGAVFIDRDPTHFRYILNFMRDGTVNIPQNRDTIEEILKEAEFYSIQELVNLCRRPPLGYHIIEKTEKVLEILMASSKTLVLRISYPELTYYAFSQVQKAPMMEFVEKHKNSVEICFGIPYSLLVYSNPFILSEKGGLWDCRFYSTEKTNWKDFEDFRSKRFKKRNQIIDRLDVSGKLVREDPEEVAKDFFDDLDKWMCERSEVKK